jgi:iron complex outermembrane receptor protein
MRYTEEDKEFIGSQRDENGLTSRLFGVPPVAFPGGDIFQLYPLDNNKLEFENFSYRVGVEYTFNDDVMTYLSLATGYKGGGWTTRIEAPELTSPTFDEEEAQTIELGVKSELFDGRARVNAAIFHTAYDDLQLTFVEGTSPITANGGDGIIKGAELEVLALISDSWNVDIGVGFLDAEYDSVRPGVARLDGDEDFVNTPEWTAHIGTSYEFMTDSFTVTPRFDWMFQTEVFNNEANDEILKTPSHGIANASVLVKPNDAAWEVQAGVTNAFDKRVIQSGVENGLSIFAGTYNRPREWYLTLRMSF